MGKNLTLSTSYKNGLIHQEYFSEYDLKSLLENQNPLFTIKSIGDYFVFLKAILENNQKLKLENKLKKVENILYLEIPMNLGIIQGIKFELKEKEITEKEKQNNILEILNKIYNENEELKKKVNALQTENEQIKEKLEEKQKKI